MTPSSYKPPQINDKNRGLLRVAHQFVIKHPTGDTQAFINYIHGNNAEFHRRKEKHWRKDAIKALKFVQVAKQRGWRLPGSGCDNNNGDDGGDWYMDFSGGEYIEEPDYRSSLNEASLRRIRETAAAASGNHATPTSIATTGDEHDDLEPVDNGDDIASSSATPLPPPSKRRRRLRKSDEPAGAAAAVSSVERRSLATRLVDEMELEFSALCRVAVAALSCPPSLVTEELQGCFVLGSPKSGKTTLVRAVAALSGMPLCELHLDWFAGKTAEAAAAMWQAVLSKATAAQPCLLLLHSVDRLSTVSEANKPLAACRRALLNCLPEFVGTRVLLIGESSSALTDMDDGLLCAFRKVVRLGLLDRRQRAACLSQLFASAGVRLLDCSGSDLLESCSLRTVGFNVGDLKQLVREAVEDAHVSLRLPHSGGG
uniref:ATPase_AAA_core domain-containing protein n=1 Tax=Macrostomum lignano TaxID=282301 RepID=A0A1I8H746_9PLAT